MGHELFILFKNLSPFERRDLAVGYMGRDVEVVSLDQNRCLVAACDSCGAVGSKEFDAVKVSPYIVGRFTARVVLLEILATAAKPLLLTVASANEPHPTTAGILEGVNDELKDSNLPDLPAAISSEKNMPTKQTGLGISVIGLCQKESLRIATSRPGDDLYCLGLPKVGSEVADPDDPEIIRGKCLQTLLASPGVHDIIPVGSHGIRGEAELIAAHIGSRFEPETNLKLDLDKSAGPSTCLIFACVPEIAPPDFQPTPLVKIGRIQKIIKEEIEMTNPNLEAQKVKSNVANVKRISIIAVFIALSAIGSLIKIPSPVGTIGLDSAPGFFVALAFGGSEGALVIAIGHLLTAAVVGFPLTIPIHIFIAAQMALWALAFRWVHQKVGLIAATVAATILNGVVSSFTMIFMGGMGAVIGTMPFLVVGSAINIVIAAAAYRAIKGSKLI